MYRALRIQRQDNVAVALEEVPAGGALEVDRDGEHPTGLVALETIQRGHKVATRAIAAGEDIVKYGVAIGHATRDIPPGAWVHTHNMATNLSGEVAYAYRPEPCDLEPVAPEGFRGFRRADGHVAVRNDIWVVPTVGCVNGVARRLAEENQDLVGGSVGTIRSLEHPFGCSQAGADLDQTSRLLAALVRHPNAGGVLVVSLGCENLTHERFLEELGPYDEGRVRFLTCQDVGDELEAGRDILRRLVGCARGFERVEIPVDELVIGLKCGGSDGLSGISANPVIGRVSDMLVARGGTSVLGEVPEMFGAESFLMGRCASRGVFDKACAMLNGFKQYFISHHEPVYDNPSPGNRTGGITTLEDKACGCVQKGGTAPIEDVIGYGESVTRRGLNLVTTPGNDLVSTTALAAAGAHLLLFSTGRGTPFGSVVPTLKVSTNSALAARKPSWIDYDAGVVVSGGASLDEVAAGLWGLVLKVASGAMTASETNGFSEIAIWKDGVTL
ncbi:UxaA family hydrolase [Olsenella profusa]|uniref:D-galactarate dehydratase/altronate hydrolase, C-terminal domain protein n=1 Tax=Olsenella profusa F0195 TaxID=1125712 RepID=U2T1H4_9ACTN|nr:altronate dehydratase family protein [Olsenella profusa]ERL06909.1 D-galactarate dehydratase/altronate hydrolase, C-terminal domain protein [Olsenella profusa F0195]